MLTEEQIVQAAMRLAGAGHLGDVSMRSLAQELGVPVMTMYNYAANKDALYELVTRLCAAPGSSSTAERGRGTNGSGNWNGDARCAMGKYPGVNFIGLGLSRLRRPG